MNLSSAKSELAPGRSRVPSRTSDEYEQDTRGAPVGEPPAATTYKEAVEVNPILPLNVGLLVCVPGVEIAAQIGVVQTNAAVKF